MDKNKKIITVFEGLATVVLGVLIAIFGTQTLATYFGILFLISGAGFLVVSIAGLAKLKTLVFGAVLAFTTLVLFGVVLLVEPDLLDTFIRLFVYFIIALGGALLLHGIYFMIKHNVIYGIGQMTLGAIAIVLGVLYRVVIPFRTAFWIVIGVVVALYGILLVVDKKKKKDILKQIEAK